MKFSSLGASRRRQWHPTPVLLPGKSHGRRSLVGCSPWDHEESDTTERLLLLFTFALEKEMATHSSVLAWRIPGTGDPGRLPSMGSHRVGHDWSDSSSSSSSELLREVLTTQKRKLVSKWQLLSQMIKHLYLLWEALFHPTDIVV